MVHSPSYLRALTAILTLQALGIYEETVKFYGGKTYMFRCFVLGDFLRFGASGTPYITDSESWSAKYTATARFRGEWVID